jgi:hypothetical protein
MLDRRKTALLAGALATMVAVATVAGATSVSAAGTLTGNAEIVNPSTLNPLANGGQGTPFQVRTKPLGGKCLGDSSNGTFVYSYITQAADVSTLTFNGDGPVDPGGSPTLPLIDTTGAGWTAANTAPDKSVVISPQLNFAALDSSFLPAGDYSFGMTCVGPSGPENIFVGAIHINPDLSWMVLPDPAIPEFPFAIVLPVSALVILLGVGLFETRRRSRKEAAPPALAV